jgi:phosphotransferase system HPr-like phosphotransfer protein
MPSGKKSGRNRSSSDHFMTKNLDDLAKYEEFCSEVLPKLRDALVKGQSAEDIYKMAAGAAAARNVTIALTSQDEGKALTAIKDILDREQGKARERLDITGKLEKLPEEQLDAALETKLRDMGLAVGEDETLQ